MLGGIIIAYRAAARDDGVATDASDSCNYSELVYRPLAEIRG